MKVHLKLQHSLTLTLFYEEPIIQELLLLSIRKYTFSGHLSLVLRIFLLPLTIQSHCVVKLIDYHQLPYFSMNDPGHIKKTCVWLHSNCRI